MAKKLSCDTRFSFPWDDATEDGRQLVCRVVVPAGTDRRRVKREFRKLLNRMGFNNVDYICKVMGYQTYVR